jgi:hypothetical protein
MVRVLTLVRQQAHVYTGVPAVALLLALPTHCRYSRCSCYWHLHHVKCYVVMLT